MADPALKDKPVRQFRRDAAPTAVILTETGLKALIVSILIYWGAAAILLPVTTSDCQVYNLARLSIAERAGFWQERAWNSVRQVTFPWTFDAVHYPFLRTGWGFALPSFLAFLGLLVIVYQLVKPKFGAPAALWAILTLLSMPTLMLQATTTKNDIVIAFGVGCWIYSLARYHRNRSKFFLFTAALSVAFMAGSKNIALGICAIAAAVTIWVLRREFRAFLFFVLLLGPLLVPLGSVETYLLSWKLYHDPIGPKQFVTDQLNGDGIRGAIANLLRYSLANVSIGIDGVDCFSGFPKFLEAISRDLLGSLGLSDAGCRSDFKDASLPFLKDGFDSGYDFGIVGCLALLTSFWVVWRPRWTDARWALSAAGFVAMLPVCFAIAWAPWNVRYFCLSLTLFGISLALLVFRVPGTRPLPQGSLGVIVVWSAISLPLHCAQRRPLDLWNALVAREGVGLGQRPELVPVYDDVLRLRMNRASQWFLVANENAWTLPFLNQAKMEWQLTPQWEQVEARLAPTGSNESYALVLNARLPQDLPVEVLKQYPLSTFIVRVFPPK